MEEFLQSIGLTSIHNFISLEEESFLLSKINRKEFNYKVKYNRNSIERYGSSVPYNSKMASSVIPEHFNFLLDRLVEQQLLEVRPNHITVNEYYKGQEILPHIDSEKSGEVITILSLCSDAIMVFNDKKKEKVYQELYPSRTLFQLRGEIRYKWQHSILPVADTRYSLVFRNG